MSAITLNLQAASTELVGASEGGGEPAISVWVVGAMTLAILVTLLLVIIAVGGGRDHS